MNKITIQQILIGGLLIRLLAAIFSPGFAFCEDQVEIQQLVPQWQDGMSYPFTSFNDHAFNLTYPGFLYLLLQACHSIGIDRPEHMMFVVRLVHAFASLFTIYFGYKLTLRLAHRHDTGVVVALLLAFFWLFPFMSVRNLGEFFCLPFLVIASFHVADEKLSPKSIILSALVFALACSIRLQILVIPLVILLYLLLVRKTRKPAILFGAAWLLALFLILCLLDILFFGNGFAPLREYHRFKSLLVNTSIQSPLAWFRSAGTLAGLVWGLPFLVLGWGYVYSWKISTGTRMLFVSSLSLFALQSVFSARQEDSILPFILYFLILGAAGFHFFYLQWKPRSWLRKTFLFIITWFLFFNTIGLFILSFAYTRRASVEAMIYLRKKEDVSNIMLEGGSSRCPVPMFYLGKHVEPFAFPADKRVEEMQYELDTAQRAAPNYVIVAGSKNLENRLNRLRVLFPALSYERNFSAGFVDKIVNQFNPQYMQNEDWGVYRVK